jgi:hypothetical protein
MVEEERVPEGALERAAGLDPRERCHVETKLLKNCSNETNI